MRAALLVYAAYRACNHQRKAASPLQGADLYHALCEWVVEGVRNHVTSSTILALTWRNVPEEPLPPMPQPRMLAFLLLVTDLLSLFFLPRPQLLRLIRLGTAPLA